MVDIKKYTPKSMDEYYDLIDKANLKVESLEDFKLLTRMLHAVTKKAVVSTFKYESKEKAREDYLKQIEYIKYGVMKKGGSNV